MKSKKILKYLFETLIYIFCYGLILIAVSILFPKTFHIDNNFYGLYGFIASLIIYILNKTIKPVIVWLTIPITALTLGLFYPFINVFILHIVHFILGRHFVIKGIFMSFIVAVLISIMNHLIEKIVIKPLLSKENRYE